MKTILFFILPLLLGTQVVCAQSSFLPKNLGPSVNSSYDEINPVLTPDGKTLFFVRANHPENTFGEADSEDIWYSNKITDSTWSQAVRLPDLNIGRYNAVLSLSADGNAMLLNGIYSRKGSIWKKRGLSVSTKTNNTWTTPRKLKIKKLSKKNRGMKSSGTMSADGQFIILSFSKKYHGEKTNLFVSSKKENGKWRKPKKIKYVNSKRNEDAPFLSADSKTLYFSSNRVDKNKYDIYKTQRTGLDWKSWGQPVLLSDTINSQNWESYFKTNTKGSWAYFASTNKSLGKSDIYRIKMFEENPYVVVSGIVRNSKTKLPLTGKTIAIKINGQRIDSIHVNSDSATYKVKLPLRKQYSISADALNFVSSASALDVSTVKEFTRRKLDLQVAPLPYVLLKGNLLVQNTGTPVPSSATPRIWINNVRIDSAAIDANLGTYEVKVLHGVVYDVKVEAVKYNSVPQKVDLTTVDEYQEIIQDLFVSEEKMAVVSGKILDKKTGKPLAKRSAAKVNVEGMTSVLAEIDTLTGTYTLKLPLKAAYTINASAPDYYPVYEPIDLTSQTTSIKINRDLVIVPIEVGQSIRLNNIFFESGKAVLKKESFPELDRVVQFLTSSTDIKIEIGGHTDDVGKAATNLKLSQSRAQSVADYIVKKGISKARVVAKGYGLTKPVVSNKTKEGKAQNRRVEFTVIGK